MAIADSGRQRGSVTAEFAVALPALIAVLAVAMSAVAAATAQVRCVDAARCVRRPARAARAAARRCAAPEPCSRPLRSLLSHPVLMLPGRPSHLMPGWQRGRICLRRRRRCWPVRPTWSPGAWRKDCSLQRPWLLSRARAGPLSLRRPGLRSGHTRRCCLPRGRRAGPRQAARLGRQPAPPPGQGPAVLQARQA